MTLLSIQDDILYCNCKPIAQVTYTDRLAAALTRYSPTIAAIIASNEGMTREAAITEGYRLKLLTREE